MIFNKIFFKSIIGTIMSERSWPAFSEIFRLFGRIAHKLGLPVKWFEYCLNVISSLFSIIVFFAKKDQFMRFFKQK